MTDIENLNRLSHDCRRSRTPLRREERKGEGDTIPMLLRFLFGEAAELAQRQASERLLRWCQAYEDWLSERRTSKPSTVYQANRAWEWLLGQVKKMPWEITQADMEAYADWMDSKGYSPMKISINLGFAADFYRWCSERGIDAECGEGFNPAEKVRKPKVLLYKEVKLLSRGETERLLGFMQRDLSPLGQRDYAFVLARLRLGVPLGKLRKLKWGQIEHDACGARVRWRAGAQPYQLPEEVWEAMRLALDAGGRLEGMKPQDYVFAPLAEPNGLDQGDQAQDWMASRCLMTRSLHGNLKLYGRLAGIPEEKLNLNTLRLTAIRLRMDEGASIVEMQTFMDTQVDARATRYRLKKMPELPRDEPACSEQEIHELSLPQRGLEHYRSEELRTHGFYARRQPPQAVADMLQQDIQGIDEEFAGLRILGRGLLARQEQTRSSHELASLMETYTLLAYRLDEMVRAEKELQKKAEDDRSGQELLEFLERTAEALFGPAPAGDEGDALPFDAPELDEASRQLVEEVASLRCVIRNAFALAMDTPAGTGAEDTRTYIRMVDVYGSACTRMVRLLKSGDSPYARLREQFSQALDKAIEEFTVEWNLRGDV